MNDENGDDTQDDETPPTRSREYYTSQDPVWLPDAEPDRVVNYYTLSFKRLELLREIGDTVGFEVEDNRDRLNKEELAKILVWIRAVEGKL